MASGLDSSALKQGGDRLNMAHGPGKLTLVEAKSSHLAPLPTLQLDMPGPQASCIETKASCRGGCIPRECESRGLARAYIDYPYCAVLYDYI